MSLDDLLIKTSKLLIFHEHNKEDPQFIKYFNRHFFNLRCSGYQVELTEISRDQIMIQLTYGEHGVTRPEIINVRRY